MDTTTNPDRLRAQLIRDYAEYLVLLLRNGDPRTLTIGDVFVQMSVHEIAEDEYRREPAFDPDDDTFDFEAAWAALDEDERAAIEAETAMEAQRAVPLESLPDASWAAQVAYMDSEADYECRRNRLGLLVDLNGLGCRPSLGKNWTAESDSFFDPAQQERLRDLGFRSPEEDLPLWWTDLHEPDEAEAVAARLIDALVHVCGIPLHVVAADMAFRPKRPAAPQHPFAPIVAEDELVDDHVGLLWDYGAFALIRRGEIVRTWPWASEVEAAFFAIVDDLDRRSVQDLLALAPILPGADEPCWFRRARDGWVADPTVSRRLDRVRTERLRSITPGVAQKVEGCLKF